jgi:hypothetical protein
MSDERERCLELLGLKPGASAQEIKAAYRDMAKVWHPDRFSHEPRLQEKAQNKLKEINEAYEALTSLSYSGSARPRHASNGRGAGAAAVAPDASPPPAHSNGGKNLWTLMVLLVAFVLVGVFFVAPGGFGRGETGQASVMTRPVVDEGNERSEATLNPKERKSPEKQKAQAAANAAAAASSVDGPVESKATAPRSLPTVTVTIDPTTGRLATAACPIKSSMTYVGGQEPRQYCSADHRATAQTEAPAEAKKQSRLKSVLNRVAAPARWLHEKTKEDGGQDE